MKAAPEQQQRLLDIAEADAALARLNHRRATLPEAEEVVRLDGEIARLPHVSSIKIPGVPAEPAAAAERIAQLRTVLPESVTIGVSGDALGATGLSAGCAVWYSVLGGTVPEPVLAITRAALSGAAAEAEDRSQRVRPLWDLFALHGSLRVTAAIAEELGLVPRSCLPLPLRGLDARDRARVATVLHRLEVG